jgi:hypothetical protein
VTSHEEQLRVCTGEDHGYCCPEGIYIEQPDGTGVHRDDLPAYQARCQQHTVRRPIIVDFDRCAREVAAALHSQHQ